MTPDHVALLVALACFVYGLIVVALAESFPLREERVTEDPRHGADERAHKNLDLDPRAVLSARPAANDVRGRHGGFTPGHVRRISREQPSFPPTSKK